MYSRAFDFADMMNFVQASTGRALAHLRHLAFQAQSNGRVVHEDIQWPENFPEMLENSEHVRWSLLTDRRKGGGRGSHGGSGGHSGGYGNRDNRPRGSGDGDSGSGHGNRGRDRDRDDSGRGRRTTPKGCVGDWW